MIPVVCQLTHMQLTNHTPLISLRTQLYKSMNEFGICIRISSRDIVTCFYGNSYSWILFSLHIHLKNKTYFVGLYAVADWNFLTVRVVTMMTSSNGNILRVTGHLCGEFPAQRPVTRSFDVFFDLRLNKRLSKQSWGWWFETQSRPLWRHSNVSVSCNCSYFLRVMGGVQHTWRFPDDI